MEGHHRGLEATTVSTLKSKVLAQKRHRRAVARELLRAIPESITLRDVGPTGELDRHGRHGGNIESRRIEAMLHAAREHARSLVAMKRHEGVGSVVDDYRRDLGRTTNNRIPHVRLTSGPAPGTPPSLPRSSMNWRSLARLGQRILDMLEGQPSECQGCDGEPTVIALAVRQTAQMTLEGAAEMLRSVLDASGHSGREFEVIRPVAMETVLREDGWFSHAAHSEPTEVRGLNDLLTCWMCHGTGHNPTGSLPPQEWGPAVWRRKCEMRDADAGLRANVYQPQWLDRIVGSTSREFATVVENRVHGVGFKRLAHVERQVAAGTFQPGLMSLTLHRTDTRTVPRGTHRTTGTRDPEHDLDQRISERGWDTWDDEHKTKALGAGVHGPLELVGAAFDPRPSWAVGEAKHSRQRQEWADRRTRHWRGFEMVLPRLGFVAPRSGELRDRAARAADRLLAGERVTFDAVGCSRIEAAIMAELGDDVAGVTVALEDHEMRHAGITLHMHPETLPGRIDIE